MDIKCWTWTYCRVILREEEQDPSLYTGTARTGPNAEHDIKFQAGCFN